MKKLLILIVLVVMGIAQVSAQKYYIPRFKKTKIERDYTLDNTKHKWAINLGGSYNACLGLQDKVKYGERGDKVTYPNSTHLSGGSFYLSAGYRFGDHIIAGLESGFQLQGTANSIPLYATLKYYYGKPVQTKRYRWFNYLNVGPQFYLGSSSKTMGGLVAAGGGLRFLMSRSTKFDLYMGYQLNMRQRVPAAGGKYDYDESDIKFRQYAHLVQVGINIPLW